MPPEAGVAAVASWKGALSLRGALHALTARVTNYRRNCSMILENRANRKTCLTWQRKLLISRFIPIARAGIPLGSKLSVIQFFCAHWAHPWCWQMSQENRAHNTFQTGLRRLQFQRTDNSKLKKIHLFFSNKKTFSKILKILKIIFKMNKYQKYTKECSMK